MNPEHLFQHFKRISEAPNAIPRLRQFILDLAVRGKLVEQDTNDEPASELLKRIQTEKERLANHRVIKRLKVTPLIDTAEVPFFLPETWVWVRLGDLLLGDSQNGYSKKPDDAIDGIPILRISAGTVRKDGIVAEEEHKLIGGVQPTHREQYQLQSGDLLACRFNGNRSFVGRLSLYLGYLGIKPIYPDKLIRLRLLSGFVLPKLVRCFAESSVVRRDIEGYCATTVGNWGISASNLKEVKIPLPPLAEQHRIVARVDELMALCDQLEAAQTAREQSRDRLVAASLHRLNSPADTAETDTPDLPAQRTDAIRDHALFVFELLPRLTASPEHIKQLRQTILDLAVRGNLVPQDTNDEPAVELLKRIEMEKARLVKEGKIKKEKLVVAVHTDTAPYEIPENWKWVQLSALTEVITKGSSPKWQGVQYVSKDDGILFVTSENVGNYHMRKMDEPKYVEKRFNDIESRSILRFGDILMNLVGASIGRTAIYDLHDEANINQAVALIRLVHSTPNLCTDFLLHYFNSPFAIQLMLASQVITAQPNISLTDAREFPIPLPPLAEQHRIVARVDELMNLCDQLEAQLATTGEHSVILTSHK